MNRSVAGVFGRGAPQSSEARRALGEAAAGALASGSLALAWSGVDPPVLARNVVLAGSLRRRSALAAELGADRADDAERLLALAFDRWGEGMLERLRGGFLVVLWDPTTRKGFLAVDQLGVGSLFLQESPGRLSFATEVRHLPAVSARAPAPDPRGVALWLADGYLERGGTLLEGIRRLEGGHLVRLDGEEWRVARYWLPRYAAPESWPRDEVTTELDAELERAVRERVATKRTTGVLLSGGLDSSAVAALARGLDPPVEDLRAFSLVFPGHSEADESALIEQLSTRLTLPWRPTPIQGGSVLAAALEFQRFWGLPAASPMLVFNLPLLRRAAREGVEVMLDGEGGDELFGCSPYLVADRLRRGDVPGAVALARRLPGVGVGPTLGHVSSLVVEYGLKGAAPHSLHRLARSVRPATRYAPRWLTAESTKLYLAASDDWAWKRLPGPRWWAFHSDLLTSWRERMGAHDFLRQRAQLAGLESRHPLLDDLDLIELILRLPPDLAYDPNLTRPLLRAVVESRLPDSIRLRRDKSDFTPLFVEALSGPDRAPAAELLTAPDAEIRAYARPDDVRALLDASPPSAAWAWQVWRLATMECWLRAQSDSAFSERMLERRDRVVNGAHHARAGQRRDPTS